MRACVSLIRAGRIYVAAMMNGTATRALLTSAIMVTLTCFSSLAFAAGGSVEWTYDPAVTGKQEPRASAIDSSGNTILTGYAENASSDYYTIKVLYNGSGLAWPAKTLDFNGSEDQAAAVVVDGEDDIIVTGYVHNGSNYDIHTIKYSGLDGSVLWQHTFDGGVGGHDYGNAITVDSFDNVYVGGTVQDASAKDDFVIIKYAPSGPNPDGTPDWSAPYKGPDGGHDRLTAITVASSGIAVTGESQNAALAFDFVIAKFTLAGVKVWEERSSAPGNSKGLDIAIDASGHVIATGYLDNGTDLDHYTVKYPSAGGAYEWAKTRDRGYADEGRALWLDDSGNIYVTGLSYTLTTNNDLSVTRYAAANGDDTAPAGWHVDHNTANGNSDVGVDIVGDNSGDIFVTSITNDNVGGFDDIHTYKFSKEQGTLLWPAVHGLSSKHDRPIGLGLGAGGFPVMAGWSDTVSSSYDFVAVQYNAGALNAPTSLTAVTLSTTEISLSWIDNSDNEEKFVLQRRNGTEDWVDVSSTISINSTNYVDDNDGAGLTPDHRYYYRILASNSADGNSAWSNEANARTTIISNDPPGWLNIYAGVDGGDDEPAAIAVGPDNHPVATGFTFATEEGYDYFTLKLDRDDASDVHWSARYNDGDNESDFAKAVAVDSRNRVVVSGFASLFEIGGDGNTNDVYTLGYPAESSTPTWTDQYNGPSGNDDRSAAVAAAVDGSDNTVVVGYGKNARLDNDIYVIKYSSIGPSESPLWEATPYDRRPLPADGGDDQPAAVAYDPNGDVFVVGKSWNGNDFDYFVAKYNGSDGSLAWGGSPKFYNGTGNSTDYANDLAVDAVGDLFVTGYSVGAGGSGDIVTIKYDGSTGNIVSGWPKIYDGGGYDTGVAIEIDIINNDVVVAGTTNIGPGNHDAMVVRYKTDGTEVWSKFLDFTGSDESAAAMSIDRTGVVCVVAATDSGSGDDIASVMFDHNGLTVGANILDGDAGGLDYPVDVAFNSYGEAFVAGVTMNADNNTDFLVFKTTSTVSQTPSPLTATRLYTEASLSWSDNSLDEDGFRIEVDTGACTNSSDSSSAPWTFVANAAANDTDYLASGLTPGSPYCFRVRSYNDLGETSRWVEVDVMTVAADEPSFLNATALNTTDILLEWDDLTTGETGFNLQWCEGVSCDFPADPSVNSAVLDPETESYLYPDACEGQTYRFRINAEKKVDLVRRWVTAYTYSPYMVTDSRQSPTALTNDWVSEAWVELKWTDNSDDETAFVVDRCDNASCNFTSYNSVTLASPAGNVLHMRMDEASWGTVNDLSPAGNNGTAAGGATTTTSGKYASAGSFNGSSAYVSTPLVIDQSAATTQGATFAAWVYPTSISANNHFLIGTDNGGNDWSLLRNAGFWYVANGSALVATTVPVTVGEWQHLAVVFDPATGVTLNKNGANVWSNAAIDFDASSAAVHIGRRGSLNQEFFDGRLDEVSVFNRPLALAEVGVLYDHGLARYNDRTINYETTYKYRVRATKAVSCDWTTEPSNVHQVTTTPPAPSNLLASPSNANRTNLFWTDNTTTETKFVVERCDTAGCTGFTPRPDLIDPDSISFNDDSVCPDIDYRYQVKAVRDGNWTTTYSNAANVSTPSLKEPVVTVTLLSEEQVDLQWPANSGDLTGYKVSRCQGDDTFCAAGNDGNYILKDTKSVLPSGAVMVLPLDEAQWRGTPDEVSDISGNANHGQAFGGATTAAGKFDRAGYFDGTNNYVKTKLNINQDNSSVPGATFEAWIYPTVNASNQYVFSTDNGGADWGVFQAGTRWGLVPGSGSHIPSPNVSVSLNAWQHIVVTFSPADNKVTMYKNGNQIIGFVNAVYYDSSDTEVTIGRQGSLNQGYFNGYIDNAVVYNRPLNAAEVLARYQSFSYSESGLPSDTEFHYRVWPYKTDCISDGTYDYVKVRTLKPPAPINLTLTAASTTRINASWTDLATSETDYRIQWCKGAGCIFPVDVTVNSATLGIDAQNYVDTEVCEGTDYRYRVRAEKDWVSEADYSWVTDWTAGPVSTLYKAATDNFAAAALSESEILLTWSDNNIDEDGYVLQVYNSVSLIYEDVVESLQPTLWFKMDEASWGTPLNSAPGGSSVWKYGDATPVNDGTRGQVGQFDGSGDYLRVNHYAGINPTAAITVSVWARSNGATWDSDHSLMSKRNAFILSPVLGTGHMRFYIFRNGDTWRSVYVNPDVDITQWHQYTGVYDGTNIKLYVDGEFKGQSSWPGTIAADTGYLEIGRDDGSTANDRNFGGWLDDALVFDQALTAEAVLNLFKGKLNPSTSYLASGLAPGTEYFYRLRASKEVETSCDWPVEWTLKSAETIAPPAPTNLKATTINTTQIDLSWEDNSGSETGFMLQWCEGVGCAFAATLTEDNSILYNTSNIESHSDLDVVQGQTYSYRVRAEKTSAAGWPTSWSGAATATAYGKLNPARLTATRLSEAGVELSWDDSNDDETGFRIERCAGAGCSGTDFGPLADVGGNGKEVANLVANGTLATGTFTPYSYNVTHPTTGTTVRALRLYNNGSPQASNSAVMSLAADTDYVVTFEAWCDSGVDIPLQNDLLPDTLPEFAHMVSTVPKTFRVIFNSSHPDMAGDRMMRFFHYNPSRYIYVTNIKVTPPSRVTFTDVDSGLLPNTTYRYQVKTYKTTTNSWVAGPSNVAEVTTTVVAPSDLVATPVNTTEIGLTWTDNSDTETGTEIWRSGAGCGSFTKISEVGPMVTTYTDDDVVKDTNYCYKVVAKNQGLSSDGGGDWSHYAPVVISPFKANSYYQITVPWNGNMQSDFGDLRFYDETAERQLSYWVKDHVTGTSATVWVKTRGHDTINMYYGNSNVDDVGNYADFNEYFDFPGTVVNSSQWVEVDAYDAIEQNDGLVLHTTSNYSWNKALISQKAYDRQFQWELYADLTINGDTNAGSGDWFILGWLKDQSTFTSYNQFVHGLHFSNYALNTYENGTHIGTGNSYTASTDYEMKVALTPTGAIYSIRGGAFASWTLLATRNTYTDPYMRIAVGQRSHNATIHSISIVPVPLGASLGAEAANVRTSFGFPWVSSDSNIATVKTPPVIAPSNLRATAVSDEEISLTWNDETDAETRFYIERCKVVSGENCTNFSPLADVAGGVTSYSDTGLEASTAYSYQVRAYKDAKHDWYSNFSAPATGKTFPEAATLLKADPHPDSSRMINLTWQDNAADEDGYEIEVMVWNGRFIKTGRVGANEESYTDKVGIEPEQTYYYRVRPYRGEDMGPYSNVDDATTIEYEGWHTTCP